MINSLYKISILIIFWFLSTSITSAQFQFDYSGPDTLYVNEDCEAILYWGHPNTPTVTSTIGANIDSFYIYSISDGYEMNDMVNAGIVVTVIYRALDDQGNADFFEFDLDVVDTFYPVIITTPGNESNSCETIEDSVIARLDRWYNNHAGMVANDNCSDIIYVADKTLQETETDFNQSINDNCGNTRSVIVSFSAIDQFGNSAQDTFSAEFFTFDNSKPVYTNNPVSLDIACNSDANSILEAWIDDMAGARVTDNCSDSTNIIWHFNWYDNHSGGAYEMVGDKPYELNAKKYCDYSVTITFIAEDECGNTHAANNPITYKSHDNSLPQFSFLPQDTIIDCSSEIPYPDVEAFDDCKGKLNVLFSDVNNQGDDPSMCNYYNYIIIQSWETDDNCDNVIQHTRTITVIDTVSPEFLVPMDVTVSCTETEDLNITGVPQDHSDNCDENPEMTFNDQKTNGNCTHHIYRTWSLVDKCGNTTSKTQDITVTDTIFPIVVHEPSNITLSCDDNILFQDAFNQWLEKKGNAQVSDNCNKIYSYAWAPGTYTLGDQSTYPGDLVDFDMPDTMTCENDTVLYFKDVDFVFYDHCFNTISFTRRFAMVDIVQPQIESCAKDTSFILPLDICEKTVTLDFPIVTDNCAGKTFEVSINIQEDIKSNDPGSKTMPVNPVFLEIGPFNPGDNPSELLNLTLSFNNVDADDNQEYFLISGENGEVLTTTPIIDTECSDFEIQLADLIPIDQFKSWITDGYLSLTLVPNVPSGIGELAINDICGSSTVSVDLLYSKENPNKLRYFVKIDEGDYNLMDNEIVIDTVLLTGNHQINYKVLDCGNNSVICTQLIDILDEQKPEIICPSDITVQLPLDSCNVLIPLPLDFDKIDNCENTFVYKKIAPDNSNSALISFNYNADLDEYIANSKVINFDVTSTQKLLLNPELKISIIGDIDESDEYFEILSEDGQILDNTSNANSNTTAGNCSTPSFTTIKLDSTLVNSWAEDGVITFTVRPVIGTNSINPCDNSSVNTDGDNDGVSLIFLTLEFEEIDLSYYITGETELDSRNFGDNNIPHIIEFTSGNSKVNYILSDNSGNKDTCSFNVEVQDLQSPSAVCESFYILTVKANGIDETILNPEDIGFNSYDNCSIDSMIVIPDTFNCSNAGTNEDVKLYVWDNTGLMDSCEMSIKIEVEVLHPTFKSGVCLNDSLKLFANLPAAPPGTWTIDWSGPLNFTSNLENPIRPKADATYSGTYTVTVTGLNGCQISGSVEIFIEDLSQPQLITNKPEICFGEEILIETNGYSSDVKYYWYEGFNPNGILIDSTDVPNIRLIPDIGEHPYYVVVKSANCVSLASSALYVIVSAQPIAIVEESFVSLCEGETLLLKTLSTGASYHWTGPNAFVYNDQNPPAIDNVTALNQGTYRLVVSNGICTDTAEMQLVVFDKPTTPKIESDTVFCENSPIVFTVNNNTNADNYQWFLNGELFMSLSTNTLTIADANSDYEGDWTVVIRSGNCYSDTSALTTIDIEEAYDVSASNDGPICEGDSISLYAPPIANAEYKWTGPDGYISNSQNPKLIINKSGEYQLVVTTEVLCTYYSSTFVEVKERPRITALSNDAPDCLSGTECVKFIPSVFPNGIDFDYQWIGPNGVFSADSIAEICNFDTSNNGSYQLIIFDGFCSSDISFTEVNANKNPETPILVVDNTICEGDSIKLEISNDNYSSDVVFNWVTAPGAGVYKTKKSYFTITKADSDNTGVYSVFVENDGCKSESSDEIEIIVIPQPNQPFISGTKILCEGEAIELSTPFINNAEYRWTGPNFTSNDRNPKRFPASVDYSGVYTVTVIVDGCESVISDGFNVEVIKKPEIPLINSIDTAYCISQEGANLDLCLNKIEANTIYSWYLNGTPSKLLTASEKSCVNITDFEGFEDGINTVYVIAEKNGCVSDESAVINFIVHIAPDRYAIAGDPIYICKPEDALLQSVPDPEGIWSLYNSNAEIETPLKSKTRVFNIETGYNYFIWSLTHGVCINYSSDTTNIYLEYEPDVNDDSYETDYNTEIEFDPLENDINSENTVILINGIGDIHGELIQNDDGTYTYIPGPEFIGIIELLYKIYKEDCEENFDEGVILIKVGEGDDCFGVNIITPNGDGVNDYLVFPCLESEIYTNNELIVFNQWGDQVFHSFKYKNDWQGTYNNKDLPVGTYYYLLYPNSSVKDVIKGFFVIER